MAGVSISISDNQLLFNDQVAASWTDNYSEAFTIDLTLIPEGGQSKILNSGDILFDAGKLMLSVADDSKNTATAEITLTAVAISGLENLQNLSIQVDKEVNLLQGLSIAEGLTLAKVEVQQDGVRSEIANPQAYVPEFPGSANIVLTLARTDGSTIEVRVDGLSVKGITYNKLSVTDIKPVEILPVIGQIEAGDKNSYSYIEHL